MKLYMIRLPADYGEAITIATFVNEQQARRVLNIVNKAASAIASQSEYRQPKEFVLEVIETDDVQEQEESV
jgi:hypothetical protein